MASSFLPALLGWALLGFTMPADYLSAQLFSGHRVLRTNDQILEVSRRVCTGIGYTMNLNTHLRHSSPGHTKYVLIFNPTVKKRASPLLENCNNIFVTHWLPSAFELATWRDRHFYGIRKVRIESRWLTVAAFGLRNNNYTRKNYTVNTNCKTAVFPSHNKSPNILPRLLIDTTSVIGSAVNHECPLNTDGQINLASSSFGALTTNIQTLSEFSRLKYVNDGEDNGKASGYDSRSRLPSIGPFDLFWTSILAVASGMTLALFGAQIGGWRGITLAIVGLCLLASGVLLPFSLGIVNAVF